MVVAGTAQIDVVEERGRTAVLGRRIVVFAGEKGGDALAIEDAQFDGAGRHRFDADRVEAAIGSFSRNERPKSPRAARQGVSQ